jgi:putative aldouronate transport system permease protein
MKAAAKLDWFSCINYSAISLLCLIMVYPLLNVAAISFSSYAAYIENPLRIWPKDWTLDAYLQILAHPVLWYSYLNTIIVSAVGVAIGAFLYIITAYPLSKRHLKGRSFLMLVVVFTMLFSGGLIPSYYLMRSLGLLDTLAALILPSLFSGFYLILMKSYIEAIPHELEEAAKMDGASEPYLLFKIITPLCKPILATLCLFQLVGYWNNFFNGIIYIRDPYKWPLMLFLREVIMAARMQELASGGNTVEISTNIPPETLQYATLMIVMLPIICVYPFLQKYFVQGIMLGSVKG